MANSVSGNSESFEKCYTNNRSKSGNVALVIDLENGAILSKKPNGEVVLLGKDFSKDISKISAPVVVDIYLADPPTTLLDKASPHTTIDKWSVGDVTFTIDNVKYNISDTIEIFRINPDGGNILITFLPMIPVPNYRIADELIVDDIMLSGKKSFKTILRKINASTWAVQTIKV